MELTIEVMKKDGTGFKATDGKWYQQDKKANPDFSALKAGNKIEVEANDIWVKSVKVTDAAVKAATKSFGGTFPKKAENTPEKDAMIARHTAVKAVYESPLMLEAVKDMSHEEATGVVQSEIVSLTQYIVTGKF